MTRYESRKAHSYHEMTSLFGSLGITQHLIKGDIAWLEEVRGADGDLEDLYIRVRRGHLEVGGSIYLCPHQVDRSKVLSHGKEVVGKLLVDLQVRKSTADGAGARKFYTHLTTPLPRWDKDIRDVVLRKKTVSGLKPILPSPLNPVIAFV
jgi:dipeptidyl-peptidase III